MCSALLPSLFDPPEDQDRDQKEPLHEMSENFIEAEEGDIGDTATGRRLGGNVQRKEYSFHPGSCRDSVKRGLFSISLNEALFSQAGGAPAGGQGLREILLSLKTKGLCVF